MRARRVCATVKYAVNVSIFIKWYIKRSRFSTLVCPFVAQTYTRSVHVDKRICKWWLLLSLYLSVKHSRPHHVERHRQKMRLWTSSSRWCPRKKKKMQKKRHEMRMWTCIFNIRRWTLWKCNHNLFMHIMEWNPWTENACHSISFRISFPYVPHATLSLHDWTKRMAKAERKQRKKKCVVCSVLDLIWFDNTFFFSSHMRRLHTKLFFSCC